MPPRGVLRLVLGTYVIEPNATLTRGVLVPPGRDLIVGHRATVAGPIRAGGAVHLARGVVVRGSVRAAMDVVVGAQTVIEGDVECGGDAFLQHGARLRGSLVCAGRARIVGAVVEGAVRSLSDVEVGGESVIGEIRAGGRIRTLPAPPPTKELSAPDPNTPSMPAVDPSNDDPHRRPPMPPSPIPPPEPDDDGDDDDDDDDEEEERR